MCEDRAAHYSTELKGLYFHFNSRCARDKIPRMLTAVICSPLAYVNDDKFFAGKLEFLAVVEKIQQICKASKGDSGSDPTGR